MQEENDKIYEWAESIVMGFDCEEKETVKLLITEVFKRIPENDRFILEKRGVRFVLPSLNSSAEQIFINPIIAEDERYHPMLCIWIVCLGQDFHKKPKSQALYTIAHELAHVYLEHMSIGNSFEHLSKREIEADRQAIKWGFEYELRQTPYNYIYGKGSITG